MPRVSQEEWDRLVREFWDSVRSILMDRYHRSRDEADRGIRSYRDAIDRHHVGDVLYNQGEERTAQVVNGLIEYGMPQPP